ncbi:NAD(P)/FAD-dependent oxidoreductase [Rubellicoccus peritrichatus]|uniref:NAD(P)/FAD-dependent oxidoreductase n=1 Tax=Rubellicoccus peritrichatus TaxID=3080537 RepID=A0AAQ3LD90_9BACT|nr:NAD(P)/FAD-dependent oxidoreductase [Puniceicoccus sp. CR14]WOO43242.1 NAD(P)/FAD-dependent oxidoreductase [Puniceicoccus sp. CR14]
MSKRIIIVGGGAAGFFAALTCKAQNPQADVTILEASSRVLTKVGISGGGRCNVTHACYDPIALIEAYPRGQRTLRGPFYAWQPQDTIDWFADRGVTLKTEADGRIFPTTDNSQTIIDCLVNEAEKLDIQTELRSRVSTLHQKDNGFTISASGEVHPADQVLVAIGGLKNGTLVESIEALGHTITPLAPSLFTFNIDDARIDGLAGISVPTGTISIPGTKLTNTGPVLITHWGLSGPGILKLSAWGARELAEKDYHFSIRINWTSIENREAIQSKLKTLRQDWAKKLVASNPAFDIPSRLWERLVQAAGISREQRWSHLPKSQERALVDELFCGSFEVTGKSTNKEEFVTCGGVSLKEVNFKTMESRKVPGLYFAGETLDIDGITGGYNLQSAWTTGYLAGMAMA